MAIIVVVPKFQTCAIFCEIKNLATAVPRCSTYKETLYRIDSIESMIVLVLYVEKQT